MSKFFTAAICINTCGDTGKGQNDNIREVSGTEVELLLN